MLPLRSMTNKTIEGVRVPWTTSPAHAEPSSMRPPAPDAPELAPPKLIAPTPLPLTPPTPSLPLAPPDAPDAPAEPPGGGGTLELGASDEQLAKPDTAKTMPSAIVVRSTCCKS
jgi:hypothetical protein